MTTTVDIIDRARLGLGIAAIQSLDSTEAPAAVAVYDAVVEAVISRYLFRCAKRIRALQRLNGSPDAIWRYRYQIPAEMLGQPKAVYPDTTLRVASTAWELYADEAAPARELWTDLETPVAVYAFKAEPQVWPGYLADLIVTAMQARFALSVREDRSLAAELRQVAFGTPSENGNGGLFVTACTADAQGEPAKVLALGRNPLITVRGG